jgi:nucleotide-binding universal stress UspA family protein
MTGPAQQAPAQQAPAQQASATDPAAKARIVVGVDDTPQARHALQWAQFMAVALNADIEAIAAWEITAVEAEEWSDGIHPENETATQLHTIVTDALGAQPQVTIREMITNGHAADELIRASEGAQMLVVGNRGRRGLHELLMGSVSSTSATHARCPVLTIHADTPPPPRTAERPAG